MNAHEGTLVSNINKINLIDPSLDLSWEWSGLDTSPFCHLNSGNRTMVRGTMSDLTELTKEMLETLENMPELGFYD